MGQPAEQNPLNRAARRVPGLATPARPGAPPRGKTTFYFGARSGPPAKEESERFENQLTSVIERLSGGRISGEDLAKQNSKSIIEILLPFLKDRKVLFVFDNVDHYVDLETTKMTGSANTFVEALLEAESNSRAMFTCRRYASLRSG